MPNLSMSFDLSKMVRLTPKNIEIGAAVFGREKQTDNWFFGYISEADPRNYGYRFEKLRENHDWYGYERGRRLYLSVMLPGESLLHLHESDFEKYQFYEPKGRPPLPPRIIRNKKSPIKFEIELPELYFPHGNPRWKADNKAAVWKLNEALQKDID